MIALTGAIALGPRIGRKFKRDGGGMFPGHDMTIAAVGGVILWFGWYGFNPGSTLSAMDFTGIGRVATNTTLAAAAGGLTAMAWIYPRVKKWDMGITVNGFLGGLVAVHGIAGIWGTISLGLFAAGKYGAAGPTGADNTSPVGGLLYGGGTKQLVAQLIGSAVITVATLAVGFALMYGVKLTRTLRVSEEGELEGIDIHEHGGPAYHVEFGMGTSYSTQHGSSAPPVAASGAKDSSPVS
jgi:Amt family ammonium transporter